MNPETRVKFENLTNDQWRKLNPIIIYGDLAVFSTPGVRVLSSMDDLPAYPMEQCEEARRGERLGRWQRPAHVSTQFLPQRKFDNELDQHQFLHNTINIHSIYEVTPKQPRGPITYYAQWEGWTGVTKEREVPAECLRIHTKKRQFANAIRNVVVGGVGDEADSLVKMNQIPPPESDFWAFNELAFYHSSFQTMVKQAELFYTSLKNPIKPPPAYKLITANAVDHRIYDFIRENNGWNWRSRKFEALRKEEKIKKFPRGLGCENSSDCKCNGVYKAWFSPKHREANWPPVTNLQPNENGILDLEKWLPGQYSVLVECSDACKCSPLCPRRQLQRGQQESLYIYDEGEKGYGVRVTRDYVKGEFVGEFCGKVAKRAFPENGDFLEVLEDDTKYVLGMDATAPGMCLDPKLHGNFGRFLNHSCTPNAAFIETISRKFEEDVMVPRASIYTIQDIRAGEELTVCYFPRASHGKCRKTDEQCLCGASSDVCIGHFPALVENDEDEDDDEEEEEDQENQPSTSAGPAKKKMRK